MSSEPELFNPLFIIASLSSIIILFSLMCIYELYQSDVSKKKYVKIRSYGYKYLDVKLKDGMYKLTNGHRRRESSGFLVILNEYNPKLFALRSLRINNEMPYNSCCYLNTDCEFSSFESDNIWFTYSFISDDIFSRYDKSVIKQKFNSGMKFVDFKMEKQKELFEKEITLDREIKNNNFSICLELEDKEFTDDPLTITSDNKNIRILSSQISGSKLRINLEKTTPIRNDKIRINGFTYPIININC